MRALDSYSIIICPMKSKNLKKSKNVVCFFISSTFNCWLAVWFFPIPFMTINLTKMFSGSAHTFCPVYSHLIFYKQISYWYELWYLEIEKDINFLQNFCFLHHRHSAQFRVCAIFSMSNFEHQSLTFARTFGPVHSFSERKNSTFTELWLQKPNTKLPQSFLNFQKSKVKNISKSRAVALFSQKQTSRRVLHNF